MWTVSHKSHAPCFHVFDVKAGVMTFVTHCKKLKRRKKRRIPRRQPFLILFFFKKIKLKNCLKPVNGPYFTLKYYTLAGQRYHLDKNQNQTYLFF